MDCSYRSLANQDVINALTKADTVTAGVAKRQICCNSINPSTFVFSARVASEPTVKEHLCATLDLDGWDGAVLLRSKKADVHWIGCHPIMLSFEKILEKH